MEWLCVPQCASGAPPWSHCLPRCPAQLRRPDQLVLACLSLLLHSGEAHQAVANLILDGFPPRRSADPAQAAEVFLTACRQDAHRLAVKVCCCSCLEARK